MVKRTVDEFGRLDTVVNNAGVMVLGPVLGAPTEEWDRMVSLNLLGSSVDVEQAQHPRGLRRRVAVGESTHHRAPPPGTPGAQVVLAAGDFADGSAPAARSIEHP